MNRCEPGEVGLSADRLADLTRLTRRYVDEGKLPGVLTLVARHGRVAHLDTYGYAEDTIFRIYSMTKPIASVALMTLYEQGAFLLEDPVADYLPALRGRPVFAGGTADHYEVRPAAREMTVLDLLRHTSGLIARSYRTPLGELYRRHGVADMAGDSDLAATVDRLAGVPLACDPGSEWIYGISTDLVGRLCEVLSGQRFDDLLAERIFRPLGMTATGFSVGPADKDRLAAAYRAADGMPRYEPLDDPYESSRAYLSGAAGLVSTARDYHRFASMLLGGGELDGVRVLGPRTVDLMTINHLPGGAEINQIGTHGGETRPAGHGFGLGFAVVQDRARAETVATPGEYSWGGALSTCFFASPADDLFVLFLTQLRPSATYLRIRRELRSIAYAAVVD
ncbi:serine hydrolase domain-containing protein [Actinoplanes sp. NPDC051411]|uniref:serine hydrolase domain-containing protein n=1 Tax=Actinoplanes sp. NPDC051411 TaxID=3155522 RepID=UPI003449BE88